MNVICIDKVWLRYDKNILQISAYKIGQIYQAEYLYDRCLIDDNDYIEFEWKVFCNVGPDKNHYQFTDRDFKKYFIDIIEQRDKKISNILK